MFKSLFICEISFVGVKMNKKLELKHLIVKQQFLDNVYVDFVLLSLPLKVQEHWS